MMPANAPPSPPRDPAAPLGEAELRRLLAEARPGPWEWIALDGKTLALGTVGDADMGGHVLWTSERCDACERRDARCMWPSRADSALIVALRNNAEALLDNIAALRAEVARQDAERERLCVELRIANRTVLHLRRMLGVADVQIEGDGGHIPHMPRACERPPVSCDPPREGD